MFHSLQRFKQLPDYMQVWPAHGAGSACGKALGAIPSSTVGYEKMFNAALSYDDEDKFIKVLLDGQPEPPKYFAKMKQLNKKERQVLEELPQPQKLDVEQLKEKLDGGATVVDVRAANDFATRHIPGTINIPENKSFTTWAGWLLEYDQPFYLITNEKTACQAVRDLISIGLDNLGGYFEPTVIEQWPEQPLQSYEITTPQAVAERVVNGEITVLDVRADNEWAEGHLPEAKHLMLGYLPNRFEEVPTDKPIVVQCRSGARSAIGASILQAKGVSQVMNLAGGYQAWAAAGLPIVRDGGQ
jgi:hydroxyacylglutathione hydrolase